MQPDYRSLSWRSTIRNQREEIFLVLEESPSLRPTVGDAARRVYPRAVQEAVEEMRLTSNPFPPECPFSVDQILDEGFLPE